MDTQPEGTKPQLDPTKIGPCENCGRLEGWNPGDGLRYALVGISAAGVLETAGRARVVPVRVVACNYCAHIRFFAADAYA